MLNNASYTPLTRLLHASYTPLTRLVGSEGEEPASEVCAVAHRQARIQRLYYSNWSCTHLHVITTTVSVTFSYQAKLLSPLSLDAKGLSPRPSQSTP